MPASFIITSTITTPWSWRPFSTPVTKSPCSSVFYWNPFCPVAPFTLLAISPEVYPQNQQSSCGVGSVNLPFTWQSYLFVIGPFGSCRYFIEIGWVI